MRVNHLLNNKKDTPNGNSCRDRKHCFPKSGCNKHKQFETAHLKLLEFWTLPHENSKQISKSLKKIGMKKKCEQIESKI